MKIIFSIYNYGIPDVRVDDRKLALTSLTYAWHTKTDIPGDEANICVFDGFFEGELNQRRFVFNALTNEAKEVLFINETERIFEVCTDLGVSAETEVWQRTPFNDLKNNDIIRVIDGGQYCRDLDGTSIWVIVGTNNIQNGTIDVEPFRKLSEGKSK